MGDFRHDKPGQLRGQLTGPLPGQLPAELPVALVFGLLFALFSLALSRIYPERVYTHIDVFYNADVLRVIRDLTEPGAYHDRLSVHPAFSILLMPFGLLLTKIGLSAKAAAHLLIAASTAASASLFYLTCHNIGLRRRDAALMMALLASSAALMFWGSTVDTFCFSGLSFALVYFIASSKIDNRLAWIGVSAFTMAMTTTNWITALIATAIRRRGREALIISAGALVTVVLLSLLQKLLLPTAALFFIPQSFGDEKHYLAAPSLERLINFFLFTGVAAEPERLLQLTDTAGGPAGIGPWVRSGAAITLLHPVRLVAAGSWLLLTLNGLRQCLPGSALEARPRQLAWIAALVLLFELCFHQFWGDEPFLYSAHYLPTFITLIALGFCGRQGRASRVLAVVFVVSAFGANLQALLSAGQALAAG
jgi:hypothetical protein